MGRWRGVDKLGVDMPIWGKCLGVDKKCHFRGRQGGVDKLFLKPARGRQGGVDKLF